jgi:hypothetical protein
LGKEVVPNQSEKAKDPSRHTEYPEHQPRLEHHGQAVHPEVVYVLADVHVEIIANSPSNDGQQPHPGVILLAGRIAP